MSRRSKSITPSNTVNTEVNNLFNLKNKQQFTNALLALRRKYKDEELVNKIQDVFSQRHTKIVKGAKKFADAVRKRYSHSDVPFHQLLFKARAHAKKHHLTESEFSEFQRMYEQELSGTNHRNEVVVPVTNMMKVLGNITDGMDDHFKVEESEYRNLQEILKLNDMSRPLHAQAILQSLQYKDLDYIAVSGKINPDKHNPGEHVHPVIAAMFLPKVNVLESHFLYANISSIVKARYNQIPLSTRPDYELFYSLVTDPNDVVCDSKSPVADLLNRCNLQNHLWNAVLHLRNGQAYNSSFRDFITAVDTCRLNKYDNPDLVYGRHDGTVVKRILSAFSFRPTVITTIPISNVFATNPYAQNVRPTVTSIPMINVRLQQYQSAYDPLYGGNGSVQKAGPVKLSGCLQQPQTFIEGNVLVQRVSDVIYSREVLIFYVDRRANLLQYGTPFNLSRLPTAVAGFERINDYQVDIECSLKVRNDKFCLRSVVVAETNKDTNSGDPRSLVVGSSTFIFDYDFIVDSNGKPTDIRGCEAGGAIPGNAGAALTPGTAGIYMSLVGVANANALLADGDTAAWRGADGQAWNDAYIAWLAGRTEVLFQTLLAAHDALLADGAPALPPAVAKYFDFIPTGTCATASQLVHYDPANAFKNNKWVCYDVKTQEAVQNPPLDDMANPGKFTAMAATGTPANIATAGKSIAEANEMMKKQSVVFVYQNFNFVKSESNMLML